MIVTEFDHVPTAFRMQAVKVILADHHGWGGLIAFAAPGRGVSHAALGPVAALEQSPRH